MLLYYPSAPLVMRREWKLIVALALWGYKKNGGRKMAFNEFMVLLGLVAGCTGMVLLVIKTLRI